MISSKREWVRRNGSAEKREMMKKKSWCRGSFTVEAAFVVPLVFLVLLSLSCLFHALARQNDIQMAMLRAVQSYSSHGKCIASLERFIQDKELLLWKKAENGQVCYVNYVVEIPFLGSRFFKINRYQQMMANDYRGISMISDEKGEGMVYVAKNGQVYHLERECTYLRTRIQTTAVSQAIELRNQSGGKYYPCEDCCGGEEQEEREKVYLTTYGNRYHVSRNCSKLKRTVRKVSRSEVGNLAACSKCGAEN